MPTGNVARRTRRKPYRKNRRGARRTRLGVPRSRFMLAVPNHQNVRLHYQQTQVLNNDTTNPANLVITPNSLQDIMSFAGDQQAYMRDQMFTLYNHARVVRYSVVVKFYGIYQQNPVEVCLANAKDGSADTNIVLAKRRKYARSAVLTDSRVRVLKMSNFVDQYFGYAKGTTYKEIDHIAGDGVDIGTSQKCFVQILASDLSGTLSNGIPLVYVDIHVNQWVRFEDPKDQALS